MNNPNSPSGASSPNVHLDPNEVKHLYANAVSVAPSVDECIIDLGVSSVVMPPEFQGKPMTPEMATQVKDMFRHESRVYMNWAAAKRFSRIIAGAVQAHADQHLLDAVPPARGGHAREGGEQVKDAPGGELGREGGSVREEGEAAADRPRGGGVAEDLDPASARSIHPGEEAEERGLS